MSDQDATIRTLLDLLQRFKDAQIFTRLSYPTPGAVMVEAVVPGERWEIELHEDGRLSVEAFVSQGGVQGPEKLEALFERFAE
jgi:hypothetical protein